MSACPRRPPRCHNPTPCTPAAQHCGWLLQGARNAAGVGRRRAQQKVEGEAPHIPRFPRLPRPQCCRGWSAQSAAKRGKARLHTSHTSRASRTRNVAGAGRHRAQ
eukprot:363538-Chlamydomonas_euryale.AAC.3